MRCLLISLFFVFSSCKNVEQPSVEEPPFSFIGKWSYSEKIYQFVDTPLNGSSKGIGCNGETYFTFRANEFEITIAEGSLCENSFYYVLNYELEQLNDSIHVLTSNRLIRSNYNPAGQPDFSDIPLKDNQVELIVRSPNEFITYLNLPEEPLFEGKEYWSSYIRYQRIEN